MTRRSVFLHESGHSVDKGMSNSAAFKNAVAADTCVPDDYSNASYAEDWTQNNVCLTYTNYVRAALSFRARTHTADPGGVRSSSR